MTDRKFPTLHDHKKNHPARVANPGSSAWTRFDVKLPPTRSLLICTDRVARWMAYFYPDVGLPTFGSHVSVWWWEVPGWPEDEA